MNNKILSVLLTGAALMLLFSAGISGEKTDPKAWTPDDYMKMDRAESFHISPCEKWAVWAKSSPNTETNTMVSKIFLSSLDEKNEIQLTRGKSNDRSPLFSPSGEKIAFLSDRAKKNQIWMIDLPGGEPYQMTTLGNGVISFQWLDAGTLLFTAEEEETFRDKKLAKEKDDAVVVSDQKHYGPVRLFKLDLKTKKIERLTTNPNVIEEFAVSPDGKWVVTNENQSIDWTFDARIPPKQFLHNLETGTREEIFTEPNLYPFNFMWTRDGKGFYCARRMGSNPENMFVSVMTLAYFDLETKTHVDVDLDWDRYLSFGAFVTADGILVSLANGVTDKWAIFRKTGPKTWTRTWLEDEKADYYSILSLAEKGNKIVYQYSTAATPPLYMAGNLTGNTIANAEEFLEVNSFIKEKNIAKTEIIHWKGARGDKVEGILYYPHNYEKGKKYPLVPIIHGGPTGTDTDTFMEHPYRYPNLLASKGAFVFRPNYHGSAGYGLEWVESIKLHYYEYEVPDILNGIDYLIERGLVNPDKVAIMGWSNGSILSIACCLERPNFFKAACAGAGDVNWISDYGNVAFGHAWAESYFGGPPWEKPEYYVKISPLFKMEKNTTPTIIFFGTQDVNVPTEQGWEHFRALQQIGKVPVRFLLFPGEPHGFFKLSHLKRKVDEEMDWFDTYLFQTAKETNEAFNPESPLGIELEKTNNAKVGDLFGEKIKGTLVPETVAHGKLMISRFEITRAQFKEFKKSLSFQQGTENFPVNNIAFDDARNYCRWLSEKTGKPYRLLTEKEMEEHTALAKGNKENNLDYWAGYSPNPDEVELLAEKIAELEKKRSLLLEVGSMTPAGKTGLYDLGGNVAEWCTKENGQGTIMGLSAVSPADAKT
ncbi:MAG: prolyl oligopeptidase family serine peptidase, partial [Candidatus Aminicenantes bacterium]|nr:prolyl oligopeptidase family serine peptidase [Candidatus Aminicenantes bacterium]